jgi:hypothetical protein
MLLLDERLIPPPRSDILIVMSSLVLKILTVIFGNSDNPFFSENSQILAKCLPCGDTISGVHLPGIIEYVVDKMMIRMLDEK